MSERVWSEIIDAHDDAMRQIAAAFGEAGKAPALEALRARLRRRLDELVAALAPPLEAEEAVGLIVPLVFLLDEQVEVRIARAAAPEKYAWLLLQADLFPDGDGGDVFYERAAALLRTPDPPELAVRVYLFCFQAGFQGRLFDDPAAIADWKARLAALLPVAPPTNAATAATALHKARPRSFYVWVTLAALLAFQIVLLAIARAM